MNQRRWGRWTLTAVVIGTWMLASQATMATESETDRGSTRFSADLTSAAWRLVSDQVMGGVSSGLLERESVSGIESLCLRGRVSTENNGGFIQIALELPAMINPADYSGLQFRAAGNGESYNLHLRTRDLSLPWQSYRQSFDVSSDWRTVRLAFTSFEAYQTDQPLRLERLRRIGVVAIGRDFDADLCISEIRFYRD